MPTDYNANKVNSESVKPVYLFITGAPEDGYLLQELGEHLAPLRREGRIIVWHRGLTSPGEDLEVISQKHFSDADIVIFLVSANLFEGDYSHKEVTNALARHTAGSVRVVPILARPLDVTAAPLFGLQVLPRSGLAVSQWPDRHAAWSEIAGEIRKLVISLGSQKHGSSASEVRQPDSITNITEPPHKRKIHAKGTFVRNCAIAMTIAPAVATSIGIRSWYNHREDIKLTASRKSESAVQDLNAGYKTQGGNELTFSALVSIPWVPPDEFALRAAELGPNALFIQEKERDQTTSAILVTAVLLDSRTRKPWAIMRYKQERASALLPLNTDRSQDVHELTQAISSKVPVATSKALTNQTREIPRTRLSPSPPRPQHVLRDKDGP